MRYFAFGTRPSHALGQINNKAVQAVTALSLEQARWRTGLVSRPRQGTRPARDGTLKYACQPAFLSHPEARDQALAGVNLTLAVTLAPALHWNSEPSIHMRCRIVASLRATATIAHFMLVRLASFRPQALRADQRRDRSNSAAAASHKADRVSTSPCLEMWP